MTINYVEEKLSEINRIRAAIRAELNLEHMANDKVIIHKTKLKRPINRLKDLRIACIMDEFTFYSFEPECELLQVTPQNWNQEIENFQPDLFFLESAWKGINGLWNTKVAYLSDELIDLLSYCRKKEIPIVFWNKEDPVFFDTFINTAKHADYVFTTDIDCIRKYKTILQHQHVYLMPFAAQPRFHNPVENYNREDKICFAGAYYKRYPDRAKDIKTFVDTLSDIKEIHIYDRNYYYNDPNYSFPRSFKRYIVGTLDVKEIDKAYKGYRYNINMNSVKNSQSMCARRVFELLASNCVILSNYSRAVRNLFGDLVVCTDDGKQLRHKLRLLDKDDYYLKYRLLGLRKVMNEHTCKDRLSFIVKKVFGITVDNDSVPVAIIAKAETISEINQVIANFRRQAYCNKKLFIISGRKLDFKCNTGDIELINSITEQEVARIQNDFPYWSFFSNNDYYGAYYISDLVMAYKYSDYPVITKSSFFVSDSNQNISREEGNPYRPTNQAYVRRAMVRSKDFSNKLLVQFAQCIDEEIIDSSCLSIDEFNYCMNYSGSQCDEVDDLRLADCGVNMNDIYDIVDQIHPGLGINQTPDSLMNSGCFLSKSNVLLITDHYPSYEDLYRYAFIHSRLLGYKERGRLVDVFKYNDLIPKGYSEYEGIDIACGYFEELSNALIYGRYEAVIIHFLNEKIWSAIKNTVKGKRILVWIHGAEIQPWWRREFNYFSDQELENAKKESDKRLSFWRQIFEWSRSSEYSFHFVFVSHYFANEVFEDLQIKLDKDKYSIIHNYVNTDLFQYSEKTADMRKKYCRSDL
ncbi:CgeB family protein, partial [Paenibacillus cisolokensis]|uniref:CgeB family protein n=1 Tax=Paenibacillus cisolokensis TaxID=1658519 RepID=UPI001BCF9C5E